MNRTLAFTVCMLFTIQGITGQKEAFEAIKNNDVDRLSNVLIIESINDCVDIKDTSYSYLAMAIKMGSTEVVEYLIEAGADLDHVCEAKTPLMYAAKYSRMKSLKILLDAGADPKKKNGSKTVLDYAKKYNEKEIAAFLKESIENN